MITEPSPVSPEIVLDRICALRNRVVLQKQSIIDPEHVEASIGIVRGGEDHKVGFFAIIDAQRQLVISEDDENSRVLLHHFVGESAVLQDVKINTQRFRDHHYHRTARFSESR